MKFLLALALLLLASPCLALSPAQGMLMMGGQTCTPTAHTTNSVGGVTTVSNTGTTDTGTVTVGTAGYCGGTGSVVASCTWGTSFAHVYVVVNGTQVASLDCNSGFNYTNQTKTFTVPGGPYTVRIYGTTVGGTYSATSFSFPVP